MDRFLGGKSHKNDRTTKSHRKPSQKRFSEDERGGPALKSFFPMNNQGKGSMFKKLESTNVKASSPRLRHCSRSKSHKSKDSDIKKILGFICGENSSKKRKLPEGRKSREKENTPSSESSSSKSLPKFNDHRSFHTKKKRKETKDESVERVFEKDDDDWRNDEPQRKSSRQDSDNDLRRINKKLTFSSSESERENSPSLLLNAAHTSPGVRNTVPDNLTRNIKPKRETSPEIVMISEKETMKSPVTCKKIKSRTDDQELLSEYISFAAEITDQMAMESQQLCPGRSYLDSVSRNLLSVFRARSGKDRKLDETEQRSEKDIYKDIDLITPSGAEVTDPSKLPFQNGKEPRKNIDRKVGFSKPEPPLEKQAFDRIHKFIDDQDRQSSLSKESLSEFIFSQCKPKSPRNFLAQKSAAKPFFDFGITDKEPMSDINNPAFPASAIDKSIPAEFLEDDLTYPRKTLPLESGRDRNHKAIDAFKHADIRSVAKPQKECIFESKSPGGLYFRSPPSTSSPFCIDRNDSVPFSERDENFYPRWRNRNYKGKDLKWKLSQVSCTATSTRPMDFRTSTNPYVLPDMRDNHGFSTSIIDESVDPAITKIPDMNANLHHDEIQFHRRKEHTADFCSMTFPSNCSRFKEPAYDISSSQKKSFLGTFGLSSTCTNENIPFMMDVPSKKDDWTVSPKYYRRRMF